MANRTQCKQDVCGPSNLYKYKNSMKSKRAMLNTTSMLQGLTIIDINK